MKVKELLERLEKVDWDLEVYIEEFCLWYEADKVIITQADDWKVYLLIESRWVIENKD